MTTFDDNVFLPEEHPRVVKAAANLLAQFASRMLAPPRLPTHHERSVLSRLQKDLKTQISPVISLSGDDDADDLDLLKRLWHGWFGSDVPFQRVSPLWCSMGFQQKDPTSDIRGGGRLSLECLVYLVERHPSVARRMLLKRKTRVQSRGEYGNYPFACAGITLTKRLCEILLLLEPLTGKPSTAFEYTPATFYHVAGSRVAFLELFVWALVSLDSLWDETNSSYLDFGRVMKICVQRCTNVLHRLPADVVPSARSHAVESCVGVVDVEPEFVMEGLVPEDVGEVANEEEDSHDEREETKSQDIAGYSALPSPYHDNLKHFEDATEDLLGLAQFAGASVEVPVSAHRPESAVGTATSHKEPTAQRHSTNNDFFGEFGLTV